MFDVHKAYPFTYEGDSKTYEGWECRRETYTIIDDVLKHHGIVF
jgi:hypothetical protein